MHADQQKQIRLPFARFSQDFLYRPTRLAIVFGMACLAGCGNQPGQSEIVEALQSAVPHPFSAADRSLNDLKITPLAEDDHWSIEFICTETAAEPWKREVKPLTFLAANHQQVWNAFEQAREAATDLMRPERHRPEEVLQQLEQFDWPVVHYVEVPAGESVRWKAKATAMKIDGKLNLRITDVSYPDLTAKEMQWINESTSNIAIADGSPRDPLKRYLKLMADYASSVQQAATAQTKRLATEKTQLGKLIEQTQILAGALPVSSCHGAYRFCCQPTSESSISAAIVAENDPVERVVLQGRMLKSSVSNNTFQHDGWLLSLENVDPALSETAQKIGRTLTVVYDVKQNVWQMVGRKQPESWVPDSREIALHNQQAASTAVGTMLRGQQRLPDGSTVQMEGVVTASSRSSNSFELLLEEVDRPLNFAVFSGALQNDRMPSAGFPIQLQQRQYSNADGGSGTTGVLSSQNAPLQLLAPDNRLIGRLGDIRLDLVAAGEPPDFMPAADRWKAALLPGTKWSGRTVWKDEPAETVELTVADYRPAENYVRLIAEEVDNDHNYVIYEGALQDSNLLNGYGLMARQKGRCSLPGHDDSGTFFNFYLYARDISQHPLTWDANRFRLSADGQSLYAVSERNHRLYLKRQPESLPQDHLKLPASRERWIQALSSKSVWAGTLVATKSQRTADVELKMLQFDPSSGNLAMQLSVPGHPGIKAYYTGSFNSSETSINGFAVAMTLRKGCEAESIFFYNEGQKIQLRLTNDGKRLLGRFNNYQYGTHEFIDVRLQ